jgi:CheY-like chemotaxis protein
MHTKPHHILIVEDDPVTRAYVSSTLTDAGFAALVCGDGQEAIEQLMHGQPFTFAIIDLLLPECRQGAEVAEVLLDARPELSVLFISAHAIPPILGQRKRFLQKPFSPQALLHEVTRSCPPPA